MRWLFAVCFIANLLAVVVVLSVDGAKSLSAADNKTPVPAKKDDNKEIGEAIKSLEATLKENFKQLITVLNASSHEKPEEPDASCRDIYLNRNSEDNKAYTLQTDTGKIPVYCHMTSTGLGACGGGGWTLAMKIDGTKSTFHYDSNYWNNTVDYNLPGGKTGLDTKETKLPTYWNTPFSKICLGMKIGNQLNFIVIIQRANSLYSLIADGAYRATSLGRNTWKILIGAQASLQLNCNREGFNAVGDTTYAKTQSRARIGFIANNQNECDSCNSRIGFGTEGRPDDSNTCGNEAEVNLLPDNGEKHIKAMGYILVQ